MTSLQLPLFGLLALLAPALPTAALASSAAAPALAAPQATADEAPLVGTWSGSSGVLRDRSLVLRADRTCALDGSEGRWKTYSTNKIRLQVAGDTLRGEFTLSGDRLAIELDGRTTRLRRVPPAQATSTGDLIRSLRVEAAPDKTAAGARAPSPFGSEVAAQPTAAWTGSFSGGAFTLVSRDAAPGLEGTLERRGTRWPFRAVVAEGLAVGALETAAGDMPFALVSTGKGLELRAGTLAVPLTRVAAAPAMGRPDTPALQGIADGPTRRYEDPSGQLSFELPVAWSAVPATETEVAIDLGFERGQKIDALVLVSRGRLPGEQMGKTPAQILTMSEAELQEAFAADGIRLKRARRRPTAVRAGRLDGAQQTWQGTLASGDAVEAWVGCVLSKGHYATVACIAVTSRKDDYLPGARRILASLEYDPPKRATRLEQQIAGQRVSRSETSESGFFGTTYDFRADGSVLCKMMMSGPVGLGSVGGESEEWGTWMVVGQTLYAEFEDGETVMPLVLSGGRVTGLQIGASTCSFL